MTAMPTPPAPRPGDPAAEAIAEPVEDGWLVKAPRVGFYRGVPETGARRGPQETVGWIEILSRRLPLRLPAGVEGVVGRRSVTDRVAPVEYGQTLFTLLRIDGAPATGPRAGTSPGAPAQGALPEGSLPVTCPIDGVFYLRSAPGAAPFVQPGDRVENGRMLGLIEAMKSFNAVVYGGPGLPASALIVEVRAADATEVRQGAVIFVVRPDAGAADPS